MRRREFIAGLGGAAAWPLVVRAQKAPARIGFLASGAATSLASTGLISSIKQGLRENGLIEGRDYILESRFAAGNYERFPELARELAQANVSVILVNTIASVRAAQALNPPVPVVMISINDPVGTGLVASLARPGNFTTGMATLNEDLTPKMLEFQRAIVPKATVIAALFNSSNPTNTAFVDNLRTQASALGMTLLPFEFKSANELDSLFSAIAAQRPGALHILSDSGMLDSGDRIAAMALAHRFPAFATAPRFAEFGGLLAYGASTHQLVVRSTNFVKKILDGVKPGDLPVEQPTRIELWINLKTAKALGLEVPFQLQQLADNIIE